MIIGLVHDEQFGPLVVMGIGGTHVEAIKDIVHLLPPFDASAARRRLNTLRLRMLLDECRGRSAVAIDSFCEAAARFSLVATELGDVLQEIDINPIIVHKDGCVAVDAFVAGRKTLDKSNDERQTR